jgi:hypothetical protein
MSWREHYCVVVLRLPMAESVPRWNGQRECCPGRFSRSHAGPSWRLRRYGDSRRGRHVVLAFEQYRCGSRSEALYLASEH